MKNNCRTLLLLLLLGIIIIMFINTITDDRFWIIDFVTTNDDGDQMEDGFVLIEPDHY